MHSSLLEILRTFSPIELKKFEDFVHSPYFNKKSGVAHLYKHIKKYAPEFKSSRLEMEKVWKAIYPTRQYNYGVFKNLIFDLTKLAGKFITFEYYQKYFFHTGYDFLDALNEREIKNLFKSKFHTLKKYFDDHYQSKTVDAASYYYTMSKMFLLKWGFSNQFDRHPEMRNEFNLHTIFQGSTFLHSIFHTCINALNFSTDYIYNKDENIIVSFVRKADSYNLILEFIESFKPMSIEIYNILIAYYKYYKTVSDRTSIEKYFDFKYTLTSNAQSISKPDRHILYSGLRNSIYRSTSSEINISKEVLDIVKLKIRDGVLLNPDGFLTDSEFVSCVQAACELEDSDFIEDFNAQFMKYLPRDARENMEKYSLAHLYFIKKEFEKSLQIISKINYDLFMVKYYLKDLQMMNCYELSNYNSFLLLLDSYKHFLCNNKSITEEWKRTQMGFSNFLNKLFKLKEKFNEFELKNLRNEVNANSVPKKQWLLRKIEELENSERLILN